MPEPTPVPTRHSRLRLTLALVAAVLLAVTALAWANRRTLARDALVGWLRDRGVPATAQIEAIGPTTFTARMALGDPKAPDFEAERITARYRLGLGGLTLRSVTFTRPVLRAALRDGTLKAGTLDPLIREFLSRPPPPGRQPLFVVENGRLMLATDYGPVRLTGDVRVDDMRLERLSGASDPMRLKGEGFDVTLGRGVVTERTERGRIVAELSVPLVSGRSGETMLGEGALNVKLQAPYPDMKTRRATGPVAIAARAELESAVAGGFRVNGVRLESAFTGQARGGPADFELTGGATALANVRRAAGPQGAAQGLRVRAAAGDLRWTRAGGDRITARLDAAADVDRATAGSLRMDGLSLRAAGPVAAAGRSLKLALTASGGGRGAWTGLPARRAGEPAGMAALRRAAADFRLQAPGVAITAETSSGGGFAYSARLDRPLQVRAAGGGEAQLAMENGALRLTASGPGLPSVDARVRNFTLAPGLAGDLELKASGLSVAAANGASVDAAGRVSITDGGLSFAAARCVVVGVERLEFGANDVERVGARLCPAGGPMLALTSGGWRLSARAEAGTAAIPFQQVKVEGAAGRIAATGRGGRLSAQADVATARIEDTSPQARVYPMTGSGRATLAGGVWRADFALRQPRGPQLLSARLVHDAGLGVGFLALDTGDLTFAEGGLQPAELSPAAASIGSPATGAARFTGRFDWAAIGAGSSGEIALRNLSFASPAGRVEGLEGTVKFTSLAPLVAAPGQTLDIATVEAIVPLTHLHAQFALKDNLLRIQDGVALVGGGRILIESLEAPMAPGLPTRGVLVFDGVQLHDLVEATPFADKVELDAKVSGRVAFEAADGKVRIGGGELKAVQPGRLSIDRTALTGVQAGAASPPPSGAPDPNVTFTDFAYQAMENLAFDQLTATVATRNDGRLGVLFHMVGRHDPPRKQKIRLTVMDLLKRRFLGRPLPLPSGTKVDLTLDTSLNLDDLLADYANFRKLHGSGQVQP